MKTCFSVSISLKDNKVRLKLSSQLDCKADVRPSSPLSGKGLLLSNKKAI